MKPGLLWFGGLRAQRFGLQEITKVVIASWGAYIVRFAAGNIDTLTAQSDWIVP
jgi:hypothetical protein